MKLNLTPGSWEDQLLHVFSERFESKPRFMQEPDCICNAPDPEWVTGEAEGRDGYQHITLMTKEPVPVGTTVTTECSFHKFGAPLIVLAKDLIPDADGDLRYGDYYEAVLYENGLNIWRLYRKDGTVKWHKLVGVTFPVSEGERHTLSVTIREKVLSVKCLDTTVDLHVDDLPDALYAGITACEGINRFWSFSAE